MSTEPPEINALSHLTMLPTKFLSQIASDMNRKPTHHPRSRISSRSEICTISESLPSSKRIRMMRIDPSLRQNQVCAWKPMSNEIIPGVSIV